MHGLVIAGITMQWIVPFECLVGIRISTHYIIWKNSQKQRESSRKSNQQMREIQIADEVIMVKDNQFALKDYRNSLCSLLVYLSTVNVERRSFQDSFKCDQGHAKNCMRVILTLDSLIHVLIHVFLLHILPCIK